LGEVLVKKQIYYKGYTF